MAACSSVLRVALANLSHTSTGTSAFWPVCMLTPSTSTVQGFDRKHADCTDAMRYSAWERERGGRGQARVMPC